MLSDVDQNHYNYHAFQLATTGVATCFAVVVFLNKNGQNLIYIAHFSNFFSIVSPSPQDSKLETKDALDCLIKRIYENASSEHTVQFIHVLFIGSDQNSGSYIAEALKMLILDARNYLLSPALANFLTNITVVMMGINFMDGKQTPETVTECKIVARSVPTLTVIVQVVSPFSAPLCLIRIDLSVMTIDTIMSSPMNQFG
ncbi:unnamed protein product [Didymodactylos carnosus]|uniref:Uncharacterized protein n=1 Tax=Didymodactylos carnosus TaxID=1234261 RepID=A0A815MPT8_9BILA|nr:unnamed protein product [Didymodactylos carnosus]CAF1425918.1 unnamed protein product [Didymodactylos carnosus]CAF4131516.1 unnamed protein product [Didymodactylos carnosus]CAF4306599.1 unnamed protein product [Didymodactylos carnosus]